MDADERRWLEQVAAACEGILASDDKEALEHENARLMDDVRQLLVATKARIAER